MLYKYWQYPPDQDKNDKGEKQQSFENGVTEGGAEILFAKRNNGFHGYVMNKC